MTDRYAYLIMCHTNRITYRKVQTASFQKGIQKLLKINRTKRADIEFQNGSNWFSITHDTACYVLNKYNNYKKYFRHTLCPDEIFLQTILINSPDISRIME